MMKYKGYIAKVDLDDGAGVLHGKVDNIHDMITFEGKTVEEVTKAFHESVDDYLAFCVARGESPEKPISGKTRGRFT